MRDRSPLYGEIKRIEETGLGVRTQCILSKHLKKRQTEQLFANIGLKMNTNLGGKNFSLSDGQLDFVSSAVSIINYTVRFDLIKIFSIIFIFFILIILDNGFWCRCFPFG